jgi:hypothetical protein
MKIKLTPQLAYIIGLWKTRRTKEGIGILGGRKIVEVFLKKILDAKIAQPDKIQLREMEMLVDKEDAKAGEKWKAANAAAGKAAYAKDAAENPADAVDEKKESKNDDADAAEGGFAGAEEEEFEDEDETGSKKIRRETAAYFYNSAYRAYFDDVCKNAADIFKHKNEYAAQYLAGMFDGGGGVYKADNMIYLSSGSTRDEMVLLRLGFRAKKIRSKIVVLKPDELIAFIKPYTNYFLKGEK